MTIAELSTPRMTPGLSVSHGTRRKMAICTRTSDRPLVMLSMYLWMACEIQRFEYHDPNQRIRGLNASVPSSCLVVPLARR